MTSGRGPDGLAPCEEDRTERDNEVSDAPRRVTRRDRLTRGRVVEALLIGAIAQSAIAITWMFVGTWTLSVSGKPIVGALFVGGIATAAVIAQRRLDGIARMIWSVMGSFWASIGFWITSVPLTLRSTPRVSATPYPLFAGRAGWYTASDLLPMVLTSITIGVVAGAIGWVLWGWKASRDLRADIYVDVAPDPPNVLGRSVEQSASVEVEGHKLIAEAFDGAVGADRDSSRERWGPPSA